MNVVQTAVQNGANVNTRSEVYTSRLPIWWSNICCHSRHIWNQISSLLGTLDRISILKCDIATPLILAASSGRLHMASFLIHHGAIVNETV